MNIQSLKIGSLTLNSRIFLGTAQYPDPDTLLKCIEASGTELVTVGIRRIDLNAKSEFSLLGLLKQKNVNFLPNTAGCFTAKDAVLTAKLSREALQTSRIKLEVIGDDYSLYPDSVELLKAAEELVKDGFEVYPYCTDDVVLCQRLIDLGCVCVMPLASPIGSGRGIQNPNNLMMIRKKISLPIVVDAGIGTASDVCRVFEMGLDAVLLNTAVAKAGLPIEMAKAVYHAAQAGLAANQAKRIAIKDYAEASTTDGEVVKHYQMKK